jgi:hypothetical protein
VRFGLEFRRQLGAFAEEVFFHLLEQKFLGFGLAEVEADSFMIIFMCSTQPFQASLETFS